MGNSKSKRDLNKEDDGKSLFSESGLWGFYFEPNGLELISQITKNNNMLLFYYCFKYTLLPSFLPSCSLFTYLFIYSASVLGERGKGAMILEIRE